MLKIHVCDHAQNVSDHDALPQSWKDRNGSGLRGLGIAERDAGMASPQLPKIK